jgi:hypothetical protein
MEAFHRVPRGHPGLVHVTIGQVGAAALGAMFWFVLAGLFDPGDHTVAFKDSKLDLYWVEK